MSKPVTCLASRGDEHTYVGSGSDVLEWRRLTCVGTLGSHPGIVRFLLCLGDVLVSLCDQGRLKTWVLKHRRAVEGGEDEVEEDEERNICDTALEAGFVPSAIAHPPTYLNKVVVGSETGGLQLWNIRVGRRVHTFKALDSEGSGVTCIEPSPALDVAAVGLKDGRVQVMNLRTDQVLMSFRQVVAVTSLSFRTDAASAELPLLASAGGDGNVCLWDLAKRQLHLSMKGHDGGISKLHFLPR
ncbi:unnamed protein product [Discosporangium mesarthrocarpum]